MSYNAITNALFVGDYKTAQDLNVLNELGVTHVVACGFEKGHFPGKFVYFPVNIQDTPTSNLLAYLPRVVKFITRALDENGVVYVHCVHGQSRSCSVCIAYVMMDQQMKESTTELNQQNLLLDCYNLVKTARPCMAVNPGFVKQLEVFRRMKVFQMNKEPCEKSEIRTLQSSTFLQSSAYATFRLCYAKAQFYDTGIVTKFCPIDMSRCHSLYSCKRCNQNLFTDKNTVIELSAREITHLPASDYWINSSGGKEFSVASQSNYCNETMKRILRQRENTINVEPMEWMKQSMNASIDGVLICPGRCAQQIGYFDWCHPDPFISIIVMKTKVDVKPSFYSGKGEKIAFGR